MSGGSWNYAYAKIRDGEAVEERTVQAMADAVRKYGEKAWPVADRIAFAAEAARRHR